MPEEISVSDSQLLSYYGRSTPEEIEELTGIPAMEVATRTNAILGKRDYLDEDARIKLMLIRLDNMSAEVERRMGSMSARDLGPALNGARGALNSVIKEMRELRKEQQVDLEAIENAYSRQLVSIVERTYFKMLGRLEERFGVKADDLADEFTEQLMLVAKEHDE